MQERGAGLSPPAGLLPVHETAGFSSGHVSLDDWLKRRALSSEGSTARTYVVCDGQVVVGYYCLATGSVAPDSVPRPLKRHGSPNPIPVMIIGRLAVDERYGGRGIGGGMLRDAILRILRLSQSAGCSAILVHAIDRRSVGFYLKYGFLEFPTGSGTLFLPLKTAAAAL